MKKILVMAAMLVAVVSLAACNRLDPMELLARSWEAQLEEDVTSMMMEITAEIELDMDGMSMNVPLTALMEIESEDSMQLDLNVTVPMVGEENMTMFMRDGYQYSDIDGQRSRSAIDTLDNAQMAEMMEMIENVFSDDIDWNAWTETSSAERTDEGYRLEFTYNIEDILMLATEAMSKIPGIDGFDNFSDLVDFDEEELGEWDIKTVLYLDNDYLPISSTVAVSAEMSVEEMDMSANIIFDLTMTMTVEDVTIDFPEWLDEMNVSINDSELLGYWENGSGPILLFVFGHADSVEFLENGTVTITEDGSSHTVYWAPNGSGAFIADGFSFTYLIDGDILVITDGDNDDWKFHREGTSD